ncbi:MAG: 4Fe-4S binding protein [Candidatus Poribacteria bacterium]
METDIIERIHKLSVYPSKERLIKGSVAVIECIEEIPCNPCETSCKFKAIIVGKPITNIPRLIQDRCKGCGECIASCPGLAIFLVNMIYSPEEASISIPYEFHPLPSVGSTVDALDRNGQKVCDCKIIKVSNPPKNNKTAVVTIAVKKEFADIVRNIRIINI